jgi:hypothetical protein
MPPDEEQRQRPAIEAYAIDEQTLSAAVPPTSPFPARQEILDPLPLIIAQSIAVHVPASL